jgi:MarR family transcriptional regulator, 2-MHQ and catechol-resistance regulon repressor
MTKRKKRTEAGRALGAYNNLVRATEIVSAVVRRRLESLGLTMGQFRALEALLHSGPMMQAALCERLLSDQGNVTYIVRNLERRALVYDDAHGKKGRRKMIYLAPKGRMLIEGVIPSYAGLVRALMTGLTQRELEALRRICGKLGHVDQGRLVLELSRVERRGAVDEVRARS